MAGEQGPWTKYDTGEGPWSKYASGDPLKTGAGMEHPTDTWKPVMQESAAPKIVRGATATLPALGATAGGIASAPTLAGETVGPALGAAAGKEAELGINRSIFGKDETSPLSMEGTGQSALEGAGAGASGAAFHAVANFPSMARGAVRMLTDPRTGELTTGLPSMIKRFASKYGEPDIPAARDEMFNDIGDRLMRRGKEQAKIDKAAVKMPKVGSPEQETGYYPPVTKVPIRSTPDYKLTPESVPGPDTAGKGNLLSPLAKKGDPRAAQELMRRGRNVLYVPADEYPSPRETWKPQKEN